MSRVELLRLTTRHASFRSSSAQIFDGRHIFPGMNASCPHCQAKMYQHEKTGGTLAAPIFSMCCAKGKVSLPDIQPVPAITDLLTGTSRQSTKFRQEIRRYNSALAFTSWGVNRDRQYANQSRGVYTLRIQGSVHHFHGSLFPEEGQAARFCQIYIYDDAEQLDRRMGIFRDPLDAQFFSKQLPIIIHS